ncbi:hypothetical protein BDR07DRAFT_1432464 [Suillus spraguei]|nr:hypothetical protein BDR07DRAFT_1432464 [Suillus spraguei]
MMDPGADIILSPSPTPTLSVDGNPSTGPCCGPAYQTDFVQILRRAVEPPTNEIIMIIEIKRPLTYGTFFEVAADQVMTQAMFAFSADTDLEFLGALLACGPYWLYQEADRPNDQVLHAWEEIQESGDSDYVPNSSNRNARSRPPPPLDFFVPPCIYSLLTNFSHYGQFTLDDVPRCKQVFEQIATHVKARNSKLWGFQGNHASGTCPDCTAAGASP